MLDILAATACTVGGVSMSSNAIPAITSTIITIIKIGIPIILIFLGMIDLGKAVMSNDEKEMKSAQSRLIKRVIYAILVFLIVAIVQLLVGVLANNDSSVDGDTIGACINCFVNHSHC